MTGNKCCLHHILSTWPLLDQFQLESSLTSRLTMLSMLHKKTLMKTPGSYHGRVLAVPHAPYFLKPPPPPPPRKKIRRLIQSWLCGSGVYLTYLSLSFISFYSLFLRAKCRMIIFEVYYPFVSSLLLLVRALGV